jgi:hypothetical protein
MSKYQQTMVIAHKMRFITRLKRTVCGCNDQISVVHVPLQVNMPSLQVIYSALQVINGPEEAAFFSLQSNNRSKSTNSDHY